MMRKGVSPVVATVLLIAIAVISAVAVWYWVAPLTSAQATPSTSQYGFVVTNAYKNVSNSSGCGALDIKNSGGVTIPNNTTFEVFTISGTTTSKYVVVNSTALTPGTTLNLFISNLPTPNNTLIAIGSYMLRASVKSGASISGFSDVYFTC
jgi:flagellin-like protein